VGVKREEVMIELRAPETMVNAWCFYVEFFGGVLA
jgi:hypothetical protein